MAYRFRDTTRRLRILFEFMGREISGTSTRCCGKKIELSTANFSERLDNVVWRCGRMRVTQGYLASGNPINAGCRDCIFVIKRGGGCDAGIWNNFRCACGDILFVDVCFACRRYDSGRL